jgi:hypothetical protein
VLVPGNGFFAMWHGIAPEVAPDLSLMHTRDHLAEHLAYLGPQGILWARRHEDGQSTLPPFFAFYGMASLKPLTDPAFADRTVHETAWFWSIRPHYRDRVAHHCDVLASAGGGTGGAVGTMLVRLSADAALRGEDTAALADRLTRRPAFTAAHLGRVEWSAPPRVGMAPNTPAAGEERLGVLVLEGFDRFTLAASMERAAQEALASAVVEAVLRTGHYALSYALRHDEASALRHFRRDTRPAG